MANYCKAQILSIAQQNNTTSSNIAILTREPPLRNVWVRPHKNGTPRTINFTRVANVEAMLVETVGTINTIKCLRCENNSSGAFVSSCVSHPDAGSHACSNCHYNSAGSDCAQHYNHKQHALLVQMEDAVGKGYIPHGAKLPKLQDDVSYKQVLQEFYFAGHQGAAAGMAALRKTYYNGKNPEEVVDSDEEVAEEEEDVFAVDSDEEAAEEEAAEEEEGVFIVDSDEDVAEEEEESVNEDNASPPGQPSDDDTDQQAPQTKDRKTLRQFIGKVEGLVDEIQALRDEIREWASQR